MQGICGKLLCVSNVFAIVKENQMSARVLVEDALQLVGRLFDVLLPLSLKELQALHADDVRVLLGQILHSGHALVEGRVLNLTGNGNFDRLSGSGLSLHLLFIYNSTVKILIQTFSYDVKK